MEGHRRFQMPLGFGWKQVHSPPLSSTPPPPPPRGRGTSKALPFLSWWLCEDTAPKGSVLPGASSRSFQSSMPPLDSYPSRDAESDVVVLGKRELECPVFITNTVRETSLHTAFPLLRGQETGRHDDLEAKGTP